jgi:hypothetical protein
MDGVFYAILDGWMDGFLRISERERGTGMGDGVYIYSCYRRYILAF